MQGKPVLGYLSGPVDGREVYARYLRNTGIDYLGTSYMREFFQVCDRLNLPSVVVTSHDGDVYVHHQDRAVIANFPKPAELSGVAYHLAMMRWTSKALAFLHEQGCTHVVLTDAQDYWFTINRSPLRHAHLIPALHCALKEAFGTVRPIHRALHQLNKRLFYRRFPLRLLSASPLISRQLREFGAPREIQPELFLPLYDESDFASALDSFPPLEGAPFTLLFAGRITENKGVFDLLKVVAVVQEKRGVDLRLHIAGAGPHLDRLREAVVEQGLERSVLLHGYCGKQQLLKLLKQAHAVVVPTRSDFVEGFAMICAEAILAGRPLVTSKVCPALELLRPASLEAQVDDPGSYAEHVAALATNPALLEEKRAATRTLRKQFFDPANSYGAKLEEALLQTGVIAV